jgi:two-component system sensor histidine kinase UhpB
VALGFPDVTTEQGRAEAYASDPVALNLARELHDQVASPLISLLLELDDMRREHTHDADTSQRLALVEESARQVLRRTRELLIDLRGQEALRLNFAQVLSADVLTRFDGRAEISMSISDTWPTHINGWSAFNLSRIVHEALTNAVRHGRAQSISITLDVSAFGEAVIAIVDDGSGFDGLTGLGMTGMRERTVIMGGTFSAGSDEDGTRIEVRVPTYRLE